MNTILIFTLLAWASVQAVQAERARQAKDWVMATLCLFMALVSVMGSVAFTVKQLAKEAKEQESKRVEPITKGTE